MLDALFLRARAFVIFSTLCLAACSDSGGRGRADSLADLGVDDGASLGESTTAKVKVDAETILKLSTGAEVKIPPFAVDEEFDVGLKRPPDPEALELIKRLPATQKLASAPYVVTPHGTKFKQDVAITLPIAKDRDPSKLKVAWLEDEQDTSWKKIAVPSTAGDKATFKVDHFSVLMLVEDDEPFEEDEDPDTDDAGVDGGEPDASDPGTTEVQANAFVSVTPEDAPFGGGLVLTVNGANWPIDGVEESALFPRNAEDRYVVQVLQSPTGFACSLAREADHTEAQLLEIMVHCTLQGTTRPTVTAAVRDQQTGLPVMGARASIVLPANDGAMATSQADGMLTLEVPASGRTVVRLDHPDYAPQYVELPTEADERALRSTWFMNPHGLRLEFDATQDQVFTFPGSDALVSLLANSLVDETGQAFTGTAVARMTPVYPSDDLANVPGDLSTIVENIVRPLDLMALFDLRFETTTGQPLRLAPQASAIVRMPVANRSSESETGLPEIAPLYYYDPSSGRWVEEGSAVLYYGELEPYYEGPLTRLAPWSAAQVLETVVYESCLLDEAGNPIVNALVEGRGETYRSITRARTDASGTFRLEVGASATVRLFSRLPLESPPRWLSTGTEDFGTRACLLAREARLRLTLMWGPDESDLDFHFFAAQAHVYYSQTRARIGDTFVLLAGDLYSSGPEVISAGDLPEGRYRLAVHAYSGSFNAELPASIRIEAPGVEQTLVVPSEGAQSEYAAWVAADLVVDAQGNLGVTPINLFTNIDSVDIGCPDLAAVDPLACVTFACADQSGSIARAQYCNGAIDCQDGSDENNADCPTSVFQCTSDQSWISGELRCDGIQNCSDGSDESGCDGLLFDCGDDQVVKMSGVCDEQRDCWNGADEMSCGWPSFACGDAEQVPILFYCDSTSDCTDGADEQHCLVGE